MLPEKALQTLWHAVRKSDRQVPFDRRLGICNRWTEEPYRFGSPLGPEQDDGEGGVIQVFTRAAIRWTPGVGPEVIE